MVDVLTAAQLMRDLVSVAILEGHNHGKHGTPIDNDALNRRMGQINLLLAEDAIFEQEAAE